MYTQAITLDRLHIVLQISLAAEALLQAVRVVPATVGARHLLPPIAHLLPPLAPAPPRGCEVCCAPAPLWASRSVLADAM